ncbi:hypothetical protein M911_11295 [Ectothiorhodospira haloalkaliphila]|uniref:DUF4168 domain-containing protein n=1 Tax=Ectothiorhodospira haloalkaliphila TaxID=421628 RepID=W8KIS1_9GAMM|nr:MULTISPECIES: DUF4168 domain-containing protein [Ectothiorhodospira]AHK79649.1 hypothetical protein M911_11295 [Ectothiorhodospira haloalkaliphila]MCG5493280.1 DUF4168 domain-containing protein [Ectothiorhodospira variabilis]MCG5496622.1 DUF4168 domain-containing protein [Ectothiorhodospira variabilis]MCG5502609.1 DUF4168 domain-containing protein [Ectothiorhodospira variabilis]MCG5505625.1 DUF4168 domain-containing protein [Ectothiorhodospira variabilis]
MTLRKTALTLAITSLFALGGTAAAQGFGDDAGGAPPDAQQGTPPDAGGAAAPGAAPEPTVELTDQVIDDFVDVFVEVQKIEEDFAQQLDAAEDQAAAQAIHQEAQEKMVEAVEANGMNVEEYNEVAMALQGDPERLEEVIERTQDRL